MKTSLFPDYVLDDTLDVDTPNGDNGINDNNDDENCNYDKNENNDSNHLNDNNNDDDNNNNYDNDNDDQTIMIFQTLHFVEPFICEKADFLAFTHIYVDR